MKAEKGNHKGYYFKPIIILAPGNTIPLDKQPEKSADKKTVENM
jgi:hypothetical protein